MSADWGPGTVILGRYRLESILGKGGMGSVWRAEHLQLRSPVAVKLLDAAISNNQQMLARFMREAQSAAALRSPHVVQIFDHGVEDGTAFIAMELLQGESLAERIARLKQLPVEEVIRFLSQVLRAIGKAHDTGIVHRDLKPDNIFICADEPEFAKVLDFGVAKVTSGELTAATGNRTQTGMMIGTPYYMSPEQTQAKEVDARADLWAIAVIAYECLVGRKPFTGDSFGELVIAICTSPVPLPSQNANVPFGFDEWFVKGTQRDRARRFGSAREMADELVKLSSATGPSRAQFTTARNVAAVSVPTQRPSASGRAASADKLELTTGQRAVTSKSLNQAASSRSPAVYALIAAAVLIVVAVGAFVASGGASAFKGVVAPESAAAVLTASAPVVTSTPVVVAPAASVTPDRAPQIAEPTTSAAIQPAAPPSASVAVTTKAGAKATASSKSEPVKKPSPTTSATANAKDPLPPKNWEF